MAKKLSLILAAFTLAGCCCPNATAEKATIDVVEPAHRQYVEADESLSEEDKARRLRLLDAWRARVEAEVKAQEECEGGR